MAIFSIRCAPIAAVAALTLTAGTLPAQAPEAPAPFPSATAEALLPMSPAAATAAPLPSEALTDAPDPLAQLPADESRQLRELIGYLIRQTLPTTYTNTDDWGETKFLYAGVKVRRDGWQLKTKRRYHQVNHGIWRRYTISLIDPQLPQNLDIRVSDLRWDGEGRLQVQIEADAQLRLDARQSHWNLGVQLYSVHVEADARVRFMVRADVRIDPDYSKLPPDVVVRPHVEAADLQLQWFDVHRLSSLHGDPADALGAAAEALLRRKWLEPQRGHLADRLNAQIQRRQDRLRLSVSDWLQALLQP